jgi:hypothetical protein
MDATKIEILNNHYNETYNLCKSAQSDRNKIFLCVVTILATQFLFIIEPMSTVKVLTSWLENAYGVNFAFQIEVLQALLWLMLLYCIMRYYQVNCYVERQYKYIHDLERDISGLLGLVVNRESGNYLDSYPEVLEGIHIIYTWIFPILFQIIIIAKIATEIRVSNIGLPFVINCVLFICCFILTILYLRFLHCKKKK